VAGVDCRGLEAIGEGRGRDGQAVAVAVAGGDVVDWRRSGWRGSGQWRCKEKKRGAEPGGELNE